MSDIESIYRDWIEEVWNKGSEEAIEKYFDRDGVASYPYLEEGGQLIRGLENFKKFYHETRKKYSEIDVKIGEITSEGDRVTALCYVCAKGLDIKSECLPDSEERQISSLSRVVFREGKIVEIWSNISKSKDKEPVFSYLK